jgi:protein-disulfide isomerase
MSRHSNKKHRSGKNAARRSRAQSASSRQSAGEKGQQVPPMRSGGGAASSERRHARREAAIRREKQKKQMRLIAGGVAAAVIVVIALIFLNRPAGTSAGVDYDGIAVAQPPIAQAGGTPQAEQMGFTGTIVGDKDAPVTFVIYSDYRCLFCQQFHHETYPQIVDDFVRDGQVKVEFRDFPSLGGPDLRAEDNTSARAAEAAMCAGEQDSYIEYHERLFNNFSADGSTYTADRLQGYAEDVGLDRDAFDACLADDRYIPALQTALDEGREQGITGTPMFLIDNGTGEPNLVQQTSAGYDLLERQIQAAIDTAP